MSTRVGTFTILGGSTADVVITGVGFEPTQLQLTSGLLAGIDLTDGSSSRVGVADGAGESSTLLGLMENPFDAGAQKLLIFHVDAGGKSVRATLKSFDSDGFTIEVNINDLPEDTKVLYACHKNA